MLVVSQNGQSVKGLWFSGTLFPLNFNVFFCIQYVICFPTITNNKLKYVYQFKKKKKSCGLDSELW